MRKNYFVFLVIMLGLVFCLGGCGQSKNTESTAGTTGNTQAESTDGSSENNESTDAETEKYNNYQALSDAVDRAMLGIAERATQNIDMGNGVAKSSHNNYLAETTILLKDIKTILLYQTLHLGGYPSYDFPHLYSLLSNE